MDINQLVQQEQQYIQKWREMNEQKSKLPIYYGVMTIGPSGSGKSTFCNGLQQFFEQVGRKHLVINLDPANENIFYNCNIDIRDLIQLEDVMEEFQLGMRNILEKLKYSQQFQCELVLCELFDSHYCYDKNLFISICLQALTSMMNLELPHINKKAEKFDAIRSDIAKTSFNGEFINSEDVLQRIIIKPYKVKSRQSFDRKTLTKANTVYIYNLGYTLTDRQLYEMASDFGNIIKIDLPMQDQEKNKGYSFVTFEKPEAALQFQEYYNDRV
ncbi:P-loop containing nucleoside triphosphate hydrolase [Pseudocohnilembus persalinus]|uniref:GPN-loop GTPase 2 n=1 Tax=Pseudocohnilembus persalinus TaxID=266149 RepID=A0A0V0QHV6_PSEPJ|nr:P-loop containing nucleoside triphosphate hydrolase [Pseudocohnilembus persalinus]|eukprot:KRX01839.1 P-loop containing nucleoside triphosphate hydrolase [Pseudocohnilembus persalinus]